MGKNFTPGSLKPLFFPNQLQTAPLQLWRHVTRGQCYYEPAVMSAQGYWDPKPQACTRAYFFFDFLKISHSASFPRTFERRSGLWSLITMASPYFKTALAYQPFLWNT